MAIQPAHFFTELERLMPAFAQDMLNNQKLPGDCSVLVFREWAKERAINFDLESTIGMNNDP